MSKNTTNTTTDKKFLEVLKNAYVNGNRKTLGAAPIEASLGIPFDVYKQTTLSLQCGLHDYVLACANEPDAKGQAAAKTKVFELLKAFVDRVGCVCDATDILYLELAAYKVVKSKDTENKDGSITSGTKGLVPVSYTVFRGLVESLLGNKIMGKTWDSAMGSFRELSTSEQDRIAKKLAKREEKAGAKAAAKAQPKVAPKKADAKEGMPKTGTTKPAAKKDENPEAIKKPTVSAKEASDAGKVVDPAKVA